MLYKAKVAVCSEMRAKHIKSENRLVFLSFKPDGT
jgi:hypothetical protein